ncbi:MAG: NADH-quinone oxidoreductase subunit C [Fimbriimonadaceae bacterium]|nr:MAG: NADH-quinone oxidoreductase subunit C [Fimbriimonadaceae bacterium]
MTTVRADLALLDKKFSKKIIKQFENRGDTYVCVAPSDLPAIVEALKSDPNTKYDYFVECVGVDYSTWQHARDLEGRFEVVYNLFSTHINERLFVKVAVNDGESIPTLKDIFLGAEYPEREIQDLYGVVFEGNEAEPGERFLLPDDWIGFPLRKEVPLGGEDVVFHAGTEGPAVEDIQMPHAGESFEGVTGSEEISGR